MNNASNNNFPEYTYSSVPNANLSKNESQINKSLNNDLGEIEEVSCEESKINQHNQDNSNVNHNEENNNFICDSVSESRSKIEDSIKVSQIPIKNHDDTINEFTEEIIKLENHYLEPIEFKEINEDTFKGIILPEIDNLKKLKEDFEKMKNKEGKIFNINNIDNLFAKEQNIKKNLINNENIFSYRKILNDNNSFYRSVVFSFFEEIILKRKKNALRFLIYELNKNTKDDGYFKKVMNYYKLDAYKVKLYLILIYSILFSEDKTSVEKAYLNFLKSYNSENNFEQVLIFNLKYRIFKYLQKNENKFYSQENQRKIGDLLPSQYKSNGKFNFIQFYQKSLLPLNEPITDITKLVMPFILGKNLLIYVIKGSEINNKIIKVGKIENNSDFIQVLFYNESYFIIYSKKYFEKYGNIFINFSVNIQMIRNNENKLDNNENDNSQRPLNEISNFIKKDSNEEPKNKININNGINNKNINSNINILPKNLLKDNNNMNNNINHNHNNKFKTHFQLNNNKYNLQNENSAIPKVQQVNSNQVTNNNDNLKELCNKCKNLGKNELYCDNCVFEILIKNTKHSYVLFIKNNIHNLKNEKYNKNIIIYYPNGNQKNFSEIYKYMPGNYQRNFNSKFNEIKSSLCLGCFNYIKDESTFVQKTNEVIVKNTFMFKFPCGCICCSEKCLNNYLERIPIKQMSSFICPCGEEYNNTKLKYLLYFFLCHNLKEYKKEILRIINDYIKNKCFLCNKVQTKKNYFYVVEVEDKEIEQIFNIENIKHIVCDSCVKNLDKSKNIIFCDLCLSKHTIINKMKINDELKNNCLLI